MIGQAEPTSSSAIASERRRSSRSSDDTSEAWPLATMPVTPRVSASQRRWRRYAGSSIARSDVKGSTLAGMTPEKRSGSFMEASSPRRPSPARRCPSSYRSPRAKSRSAPAGPAVRHLARRRRRAGQAGKDVAGDQLDLLGLVAIRDEDEAVHPRLDVGTQLLHALVSTAADRVLDRRFAPRGHVPLGLEPAAHRRLGRRARRPDVDRELVRAAERPGIAAGLTREADDLLPRAPVALGRVEVREPAVAARGHALEDRVDVAADQDGRTRLLERTRPHHGLAQAVLVDLERDAVLGPQAREDVEVALEEPAAPLEGHADRVELPRVPARGHAEDQAALRDHVERAERLGGHRGVSEREHEHARAELDTARPRGDRGQGA